MRAAATGCPCPATLAEVQYGGQATFDGVMMRGRTRYAVAVRSPSGEIEVTDGALPTWGAGLKDIPFVRGLVALAEALPIGARALAPRRRLALVAGLAVGSIVPAWIAQRVTGDIGLPVVEPAVELALAVGLLWLYLQVSGKVVDVVRLFGNHGAEHKAVNALEAGAPLTVASVQTFSTRHPRCGTSFLLVLAATSAVTSAVIGTHVLALPFVLAVATELQRINPVAGPGMALQRLTTRQPTDAQVEVAIAALEAVLAEADRPRIAA
ncbi:MAG: hypothetical protein QOI47_1319 [Actinomycetota bacterium]|nr:hypothetical protein [Actinomycetota bacterium]